MKIPTSSETLISPRLCSGSGGERLHLSSGSSWWFCRGRVPPVVGWQRVLLLQLPSDRLQQGPQESETRSTRKPWYIIPRL